MIPRWIVLPLALIPAALAAQLRGSVADSASGIPIPSAVVTMRDSTGAVLGRTLTDRAGRFLLATPPGPVTLQVIHIGFSPRQTRIEPPGGTADIAIRMVAFAYVLPEVSSRDNAVCQRGAAQDAALAVWHQAEAAFLATVVGRESAHDSVAAVEYDRLLDPLTQVVTSEHVTLVHTLAEQPFRTRAPGALAATGYRTFSPGHMTYDSPDADVLLDESFLATHCLRLVRADAAHRGQIGVGFLPSAKHPVTVDVAGMVWLDTSPLRLRSLEFGYTDQTVVTAGQALGGTVTFGLSSNGAPVVDAWSLRISQVTAVPFPNTGPTSALGPAAYERGGALYRAGPTPSGLPLSTFSARVTRIDGASPEGLVIGLRGTTYSAHADATGRASLTDVIPGKYAVIVAEPAMAHFGLSQANDTVVNAEGSAGAFTMSARSPAAAAAARCGRKNAAASNAGDHLLELRNANDTPLSATPVVTADVDGSHRLHVVFIAAHIVLVCDVPTIGSARLHILRLGGLGETGDAALATSAEKNRKLDVVLGAGHPGVLDTTTLRLPPESGGGR